VPEPTGTDRQIAVAHPEDVADGELLQARATPGGYGVAERARAPEMNVAQGELGETREDSGGQGGDAEAAEVEGDGGGVLDAREVKGAFFSSPPPLAFFFSVSGTLLVKP
jgi:hypothetical protein